MSKVDELNAQALAAAITDLRETYDERLRVLENQVETLRGLVQAQTQVIGDAMQRLMGSGSTVRE